MRKLILFSLGLLFLASCNDNPDGSGNENTDTPRASSGDTRLDALNDEVDNGANKALAYVDRAKYFMEKEDYTRARLDIENGLAVDSNISELHWLKGEYYYLQNKTRISRNAWERCATLDPAETQCRISLAKLYIAVKDYPKALENVNEVLELNEFNSTGYFLKGIIVRDLRRDTTLALQYMQKSIDLRQDYLEAIDAMAVLLAARKDTLAKFYYERILNIDPNRSDVYYKLGLYYMNRGETNRALESYTKAIQLNPSDADSYYNLGFMHVELNLYPQARDYFSKAINARARNYKALYGRGYCFEKLGDVLNAKKDYELALEYLPIYEPAKQSLNRVNNIIARGQ